MNFKGYQICRSSDGWAPVRVPSESNPDLSYIVYINPWGLVRESICECPGYHYRGQCRHQEAAWTRVCGWREGDQEQTDSQRKSRICPRCGGPTKWEVEVDDDV